MANEVNIRICKSCKRPKLREQDGYYPNKKNKRWRDEIGLEWVGNICGSCNQVRVKESKKKEKNAF